MRFAKYPELEDLLLPRIMPLEDAGVLTIDILREQAKKLLPNVTFKPDKDGKPKAPPQLSVGWAWKVCRRFVHTMFHGVESTHIHTAHTMLDTRGYPVRSLP